MITEKLVGDIKSANFFSILADEAADVSNLEQMAIVIRFVDKMPLFVRNFLALLIAMNVSVGRQ